MRMLNAMGVAAALCAAAAMSPAARAEEAFDACELFTQEDAEKALGTTAAPEPVNPKVKRPKVIPACTYNGFKDGKAVAATALFRFGKTEADAQKAFDEVRMQYQTKPMLISGTDAFWSSKTGQMNLRKGRAWVTVSVGPAKLSERDVGDARKLAEILSKKM
jgi:pyrroloquinoline quinone (PQQ) biosynthesis protein C